MQTAVVIFSRVPLPGKSKSRLSSVLSVEECALFHRACLWDLHRMIKESGFQACLYYTGASREDFFSMFSGYIPAGFEELKSLRLDAFTLKEQSGGDLGERMYNAASKELELYGRVILSGSDIPDMRESLLRLASEELDYNDMVIGPALDGGYYLLGLKKAYPEIFRGMAWGTGMVLEQTLEAARRCAVRISILPVQRDIDRWEDLLDYVRHGADDFIKDKSLSFRLAQHYVRQYG